MQKEIKGRRMTPEERAQADFEEKRRYWSSIVEIKENTQLALDKGSQLIKAGRGFKRLNLAPDAHDPVEIPLSDAQKKRMRESIDRMNFLLSTHDYRPYLRIPRKKKN